MNPAQGLQLDRTAGDLRGYWALADAAHTQVETVRQNLYHQGSDKLLTAKKNQEEPFETLATL